MAGGRGERFWPKSRKNLPKQFSKIISNRTMIEETYERFKDYLAPEDIYINSGEIYRDLIKKVLPEVKDENLILEPIGRDTAACIALSAMEISADENDILFFVPADHYIGNIKEYQNDIEKVKKYLEHNDGMILFGIKPTEPSENYGYIQVAGKENLSCVVSFKEKPDRDTAKAYLESGDFYWNSGMFFFKKKFIINAFKQHSPEHFNKVSEYLKKKDIDKKKSDALFATIKKISFDFAVVEKISEIHCQIASFAWDDVGSWNSLSRINRVDASNNLIRGDVEVFNTNDTTCINDKSDLLFVLNGINHLHIIRDNEVIYICDKKKENDVKGILKQIAKKRSSIL